MSNQIIADRDRQIERMEAEFERQGLLLIEAHDRIASEQKRAETAERERDRMRAALERIIGMCSALPRCRCGRPNGLPAVVMCANKALARKERHE